ncbi:MAG: FHA domain-containing protein [Bacteroidales bacterium]|nr:FHA domain-containing protein [Bacteroidales bacterium]
MAKTQNIYQLLVTAVLSLLLTGCLDKWSEPHQDHPRSALWAEVGHSTKCDSLWVDVTLDDGADPMDPDSIAIIEYIGERRVNDKTQPRATGVSMPLYDLAINPDDQILFLADLCVDSALVERQKKLAKELYRFFPNNAKLAFITADGLTPISTASDYVIDKRFVAEKTKNKYLYRGIVNFLNQAALSPEFSNYSYVVVASDSRVYDGSIPMDPDHFKLQQQILDLSADDSQLIVNYVNLGRNEDSPSLSVIKQLCDATGGNFYSTLSRRLLLSDLLDIPDSLYVDYRVHLVNPDGKVYRGEQRLIHLECFQGSQEQMIDAAYTIGTPGHPVIVNNHALAYTLLLGIVFTLIILIGAYAVLQLLVPYIMYRIFQYKYVTRYLGSNSMWNGVMVPEECCFCRTKFNLGDRIVAKCKHVVHLECWEENGHKCPESGARCTEGSHYYNKAQLLDPRNAPFIMNWILLGVVAGGVAWVINTLIGQAITDFRRSEFFTVYAPLIVCFFTSLVLSLPVTHRRSIGRRVATIAIKTGAATLAAWGIFALWYYGISFIEQAHTIFILDAVPWAVMSAATAIILSYDTNITRMRLLLAILCSLLFVLISNYVWDYSVNLNLNANLALLWSHLIYTVGLAVSLAVAAPKVGHNFLKVTGQRKPLDVAIYKWFDGGSDHITIGKSAGCNLQMSWSFDEPISPQQAAIIKNGNRYYLQAIEPGVFQANGQPVEVGENIRLYHGSQFRIGSTTFTYIEQEIKPHKNGI